MGKKYKIKSSSVIVNMLVSFSDESNETDSVTVAVDFANERVHFSDKREGIDYAELESLILAHAKPQAKDSPALPIDINKQIQSLRMGNIQASMQGIDPNKNRR